MKRYILYLDESQKNGIVEILNNTFTDVNETKKELLDAGFVLSTIWMNGGKVYIKVYK